MHKRLVASWVAVLVFAWAGSPARGQSQSWKVQARERSQTDTSRAVTELTHGQVDNALSSLQSATGEDPSDALPFSILGLALDMKGRYQEAVTALHSSWEINSRDGETAVSIGITHYLMHNYDKAIAAWQKAVELNPKLCQIYGDIGCAFLRKGDFKEAEDNFQRLISCVPNSQFGYQGLATARYLSGDIVAARQFAEHSQSIATYPPVILLLAKLDALQGDRARAVKRLLDYTALTRKPGWQRSMTAIGYAVQHDFKWDPYLSESFDNAYLLQARLLNLPKEASRQKSLSRQGKADEVISREKEALGQAPHDYILLRELALTELANGDYAQSAEHFKQELQGCPDCLVDWLHAGRALSLDGKAAEASSAIRTYQRHYPSQQISGLFTDIAGESPAPAVRIEQPADKKPATIAVPEPSGYVEKESAKGTGGAKDPGF